MEKNLSNLEKSINNIILKIKENNSTHSNIIYIEFYNLITENITNQKNITFIFHTISRAIVNSEKEEEKENLLKLLPEFFLPFKNDLSKTFPFLSRILTTIQSNIHSKINLEYISKIFKEILQLLFNINNNIEQNQNKQNYEIFQGFCIYNMKQNDELCQICGVLCLKELIINLNYFLKNNKYIKYLWEKLILFIENDNFTNKLFLLQCFNELIYKCKDKFKQFANITMYKILDFLQDNENELRKEALNILYLLIFHCPKDISSLKNQLIDFISVLQEENDEFIQNKCNQILKLLNDNNDKLNESSKIISSDSKRNDTENNELRNKINKMKKSFKSLSENKLNNINESNNNINNNNMNNSNTNNNSNINESQNKNKYIKKEKESIFKTRKNKDFFDKVNKIDDIYIVDSLHNQNLKYQNSIENEEDNLNNISSNYNYRKYSKDYSYNSNNNNTLNSNTINTINNNNTNYNTNNKNNYYMISSESNNLESGIKKNNNIIIENKNDDYSQLIQKMADLSEKQVILIDCLSQLRNDFLNITSNLNNRVDKLEKILLNPNSSFNNFNNGLNKNYFNKNNFSNNNFSINNFNNYINDPIQNLIDENNLNSLLNNLSKFNFEDLNEIPIQTLENVIYYFIHKIQNEQNIPLDKIISIFKKIMIGLKNKIANDCKENLEHTLKKILNDLNMNEDNVIEIKLILSYLKN